jgi:hypothetical protein
MGPWLDICTQCGTRHRRNVSDMLLPQVICENCGQVKINSPGTIEKTRQLLTQNNWYVGFADLLLSLEERLEIAYADADFPHPFVTARQLMEVTKLRCGNTMREEEIMQLIGELAGITISDPDAPLAV